MSRDQASERPATADLPEPIREWLARRAAEEGLTEEELLTRLLYADPGLDPGARPGQVTERLDEVEASVAELASDLDEMIRDVRERVLQVKREADGKAARDHDHPDIEERLDALADDLDDLAEGVEANRDDVDDLDDYVVSGFENYAVVLEHLVETTASVEDKLDLLADTVLDLRDDVDALAEDRTRRAVTERLARTANVHGARRARCEGCGETVDVGLLSVPECPHCQRTFVEFVPKEGLFGSHVLALGDPPTDAPEDDRTDADDLDGESASEPPDSDPAPEDAAGRAGETGADGNLASERAGTGTPSDVAREAEALVEEMVEAVDGTTAGNETDHEADDRGETDRDEAG